MLLDKKINTNWRVRSAFDGVKVYTVAKICVQITESRSHLDSLAELVFFIPLAQCAIHAKKIPFERKKERTPKSKL